jgi:hypothetical protein
MATLSIKSEIRTLYFKKVIKDFVCKAQKLIMIKEGSQEQSFLFRSGDYKKWHSRIELKAYFPQPML